MAATHLKTLRALFVQIASFIILEYFTVIDITQRRQLLEVLKKRNCTDVIFIVSTGTFRWILWFTLGYAAAVCRDFIVTNTAKQDGRHGHFYVEKCLFSNSSTSLNFQVRLFKFAG